MFARCSAEPIQDATTVSGDTAALLAFKFSPLIPPDSGIGHAVDHDDPSGRVCE